MITRGLSGFQGRGALLDRLAGLSRSVRWALIASLFWAVLVTGYGIGYLQIAAENQIRGMSLLDGAFLLMALVLPLGLIWLAAGLSSTLRHQREMTVELADTVRPLIAELEATRRALSVQQGGVSDAVEQTVRTIVQTRQRSEADLSETLAQVTASQARLQSTLTALLEGLERDSTGFNEAQAAPVRADAVPAGGQRIESVAPAAQADPNEPPLPLLEAREGEAERPAWPDLIRALDFPRDDQDFEGFRALQAVLRYQPLAQMLQSAEDVLTLLSQEGVYMEDLTVETGDPVHWRRFMAGERGADVASVGGIRDDQALELTRALLKSDLIFRDTALFFQRRFDRVLQDFAREAGDREIIDVANTRSGRAFMLLARLNGAFD